EGIPVPVVDSVSFDGPRMIIREDSWEEEWDDATVEIVFSVGDDDGSTFFFRYQDELNWYRVTVSGQLGADTRPGEAVSIQSRINGVYSGIVAKEGPMSDPNDIVGYKRMRVRFTPRMEGNQPKIDIAVTGWNQGTESWDISSFGHSEWTIDDELGWGRAGFGTWAQGGAPAETVHPEWNPVVAGTMFEDFVIRKNDEILLDVDWYASPRPGAFPAGWENPFSDNDDLKGDWRVSAHGTITERSVHGERTSGTVARPAADAEAPMFLRDSTGTSSYLLDIGIHPFEHGGNGFVFDYVDADNYSRVLFTNTIPGFNNSIPAGLSISRKQNGVWSDIVIGDIGFIYRPGQPFNVSFVRSGQNYVMTVEEVDVPGEIYRWQWSDATAPAEGGRYGFTSWQSGNAHFMNLEMYGIVVQSVGDIAITNIEKVGQTIVLTIDNPSGEPYNVEQRLDLGGGEWEVISSDQTGNTWSGPIPSGADKAFWRLTR
ncbi:MAG TPA: hypothetical protein VK041_03285, partial [Opitutales bacterium]|nr:hypothetical protein [Opitutales bacterium]